MTKVKGIFVALLCLVLVGCTTGKQNDTKNGATAGNTQSAGISSQRPAEQTSRATVTPTSTPVTTSTAKATPGSTASVSGKKMDFQALDKLDNTMNSWWVGRESEPAIKKLLDTYGGISLGDTSEKVVYLTFDEGYENGYTPLILDTLKANNVKAAFFVTESYVKSYPDLVKRMLDEGHIVGNHTVTHPKLTNISNTQLEDELYGFEQRFKEQFGVGFKYMRPPEGVFSEKVLAAANQLGYKTVFWSFAYDDWYTDKIRGAQYAHDIVMKNLKNGVVFLLHAVSKDNAEGLDSIIKDIRAQGYEFKTLDEFK